LLAILDKTTERILVKNFTGDVAYLWTRSCNKIMEFIRRSGSCSRIFERILRLCDRRHARNFRDNSRSCQRNIIFLRYAMSLYSNRPFGLAADLNHYCDSGIFVGILLSN